MKEHQCQDNYKTNVVSVSLFIWKHSSKIAHLVPTLHWKQNLSILSVKTILTPPTSGEFPTFLVEENLKQFRWTFSNQSWPFTHAVSHISKVMLITIPVIHFWTFSVLLSNFSNFLFLDLLTFHDFGNNETAAIDISD